MRSPGDQRSNDRQGPAICEACKAPIRFVKTAAHGRMMPLDPEPVENGNVVIDAYGLANVLTKKTLDQLRTGLRASTTPRYVSHYATCPAADKFRRRKETEKIP